MKRSSVQQRRILLLCLLMAGFVLLADRLTPLPLRLELMSLDWRFRTRGPRPPGKDVVLVTIDEKSLTELGQFSTWSRSYHAELVDVLRQRGAAVIAFDVFFSERKDEKGDAEFAGAIQQAGNVVLPAQLPETGTRGHGETQAQSAEQPTMDPFLSIDEMAQKSPHAPKPLLWWMGPPTTDTFWSLPLPDLLKGARGAGCVNLPADPDAIFRRAIPLWPVNNGHLYPHLALLAAACSLGVSPRAIRATEDRVYLGNRRVIPLSNQDWELGTVLIDFVGAPQSASLFPRYSYSEVLALHPEFLKRHRSFRRGSERSKVIEKGQISDDAFRGKIVFIGATAEGLYDLRPSPYSPINAGVETNANLTNAILQNRFFHQPAPWFPLVLLTCVGVGFGRLLAVQSMLRGTVTTLAAGIGYALLSLALFSKLYVVLPTAAPLLAVGLCYAATMAYQFQTEYRERLRNRAYLDLYVTRQVAERILNDPEAARLGGQRVDISVLFSDIRGFTTMSEGMRPEDVVAMLNEYFEKMVPIIMGEEGTLDKYVGDAIMGVWGAPVEQPDHARRAVRAGLAMLQSLRELHAAWRERGLPTFNIGIGINSGEAVAGNIGTNKRVQYTVIGDTVNTASRLEGLNKELGTSMIISAATYRLVEDMVEVRPLPPVTLRGKVEPVTVYEVLGPKGAAAEPVTATAH